jgi:hypothetical protein
MKEEQYLIDYKKHLVELGFSKEEIKLELENYKNEINSQRELAKEGENLE